MLVQPIRHGLAKLGVVQALLPYPLRVAPSVFVARRIGAGAVFVQFQKRVLRIPNIIPKSFVAIAVADSVPVVCRAIGPNRRDGSIQIPAIKNHQHVVDQVIDIQKHIIIRISRAVRIVAEDTLVSGIGFQSGFTDFPESLPRGERTIGGE